MKAKSLKVVLAAIFLTAIMASTSFAAFVTANVLTASSTDGSVSLKMTFSATNGSHLPACTAFHDAWFTPLTANMDDQTLAVALTAISLGKTVKITVTTCPPGGTGPGVFSSIGLNN
jgi:hypothetical protein